MEDSENCWDAWFDGLGCSLRSGSDPDQRRILEPVVSIRYEPHFDLLEALPFPTGAFWYDDEG